MMKIFSNNFSISSISIVVSFSLLWGGCAPTDHTHSSSDVESGPIQVGEGGGGGGGSTDFPRPSGDPRDALLSDLWVVFIKPSLEDFKKKSVELEEAGNAYCNPTVDSSKKEALKQAWSEAFKSYRYLAVFPFGGKWKNNPLELINIYGVFETDLNNVGSIRNVDPKLKDLKEANKTNFGALGFGALDYAINNESSAAIACKIITVNTSVIKQASEKALDVLDTGGVYDDFKRGNRSRFQSGKTQSISAIAARLGQATDFLLHKLNDPIGKKKSLMDGYYSKDQSIPLLKKMFEGIEKYYRLEDSNTSFRSILSSVNPKSAEKIDKDIDKLKKAFDKLQGNSYEDAIKQQRGVVDEIVGLARTLKSSFRTNLMVPLSFSTDPADSDGD